MTLVNIVGMYTSLDEALVLLCKSGCFHIEPASADSVGSQGLKMLNEQNPYLDILKRLVKVAENIGIKLKRTDYSDVLLKNADEYSEYVLALENKTQSITQKISEYEAEILKKEEIIKQLTHLHGLNANFEQIFACEHVKVRIGRMPADNEKKLSYFDENLFFFEPLEITKTYCYGMYMAPSDSIEVADDIFKSLYFETIDIPDFLKGTPEEAFEKLNSEIALAKKQLEELNAQRQKLSEENEKELCAVFSKLKFQNDTFELRKNVAVVHGKFYIKGFIPKAQSDYFTKLFDNSQNISVVLKPPSSDASVTPPTKLKNGFFSRPFAMLVEMYGLPSYNDINPTAFVALTYTILFGLMFGDLGQGFVIFLAGLIMTFAMKIKAGGMLTRVGLSSMFFGFMYGSVFGFEELLDPVYHALGWSGKPLEVFHETTFILLGAVAIGVVLISISISMNIIMGLRQKNIEKALFGANGLCGLILYDGIIAAVALNMLADINLLNPVYVIFVIVLPLVCMFMRVPLANLITKRQFILSHDPEETGIGNFFVENFFEMFEFMLSYVSNTMSFLRVGGFILSHAGMMLVVMTLANSVSAGASPIVIVIGNLFVMAMEGMIVAIQVIRLEFYEIFSRFYDGDGKPFEPVSVDFTTEIEG